MLLTSTFCLAQTFHKVGQDMLLEEGTVNQTRTASYVYLKNESNYNIIKNDIYSFFDSQINLNKESYDPTLDQSTSFLFYIYKETLILNSSFIFDENANPDTNPMINGHNSDIIAIVSYRLSGETKSINFFLNKKLDKIYAGNTEREITDLYRNIIGDLE